MATNMMDRIRGITEHAKEKNKGGSRSRQKGIFHSWHDGDNIGRLVGDFLEVWTHFIAPAPKRNDRGLCRSDAFSGDGKLSMVVNCANWDVEKGHSKDGGCVICKLNALSDAVVRDPAVTEEEKEKFMKLRADTSARQNLKWNYLDRDDPYITVTENGNDRKEKGLKITTLGQEAWKDINGIFLQMGSNIADDDIGIDICVKRVQAKRTTYSAGAVLDTSVRPPCVKQSPLTAEERAMKRHDLLSICGKATDQTKIMDALHDDLRSLIEVLDEETAKPQTASQPPVGSSRKAAATMVEDDDDVEIEDDDEIVTSKSQKKR